MLLLYIYFLFVLSQVMSEPAAAVEISVPLLFVTLVK